MDHIQLTYSFDHSCYYDEDKKIRFEPPVYEQRYLIVLRLLELDFWQSSFKKIVEFGCAEMKFFTLLKTLPDVEQILQVDIDEELLNKWQHSVRPLFVDFIQRRAKPFSVEVWRGSISSPHECLKDTDVVVGIEIIEHLHSDVLEGVPENVFGFIRPKVAMFSTPNSEYNVMFDGLLDNGFRHDDHKFEWTRAQFTEWCDDIIRRYPDYMVKYFGIGPPPKDHPDDIGYVSQLAVFVRRDFIDELEVLNIGQASGVGASVDNEEAASNPPEQQPSGETSGAAQPESKIYFDEETREIVVAKEEDDAEQPENRVVSPEVGVFRDDLEDFESPEEDFEGSDHDEPNARMIDFYLPVERSRNDSGNYDDELLDPSSHDYKLLYSVDYPVQEPDRRERSEKLLDEAEYQIRRLKYLEEEYYNYEENQYQIPLPLIADCMVQLAPPLEELRLVLTSASYRISNEDMVLVTGEDESVGSDGDFEYDLRDDDDQEVGAGFDRWADDEQPVAAANVEPVQGSSFQEDEELWD
ncbi:uncharacterized protein LOC134214901 [Armigeres subalbatus]|uniref:uncharacterized protein LOC134214901 n=1 Tax=Armigeres subalbatus TaxID=124917 RepID=UPI002ED00857